jgi:2-polyprenyl-6-methoxyphenol hydroxylase-like FAD-dependent oxidoreductase
MSIEGSHVAVVGGGVGGAAAAILCARAGARVTLFEAAEAPQTVGTGILLQPNGLAVLYGLDLDERLPRRGTRVEHLCVADGEGHTILDVALPRFGEGLDHALVLRREELLAALHDVLAAERDVERRFGTEVVAVAADGLVTHRGPEGSGTTRADLVVGADGVHSRARKSIEVGARVGRGLRYVRGIGSDVGAAGFTEHWTALGIFGVAPMRHATYFYASTHAEPLAAAIHERDPALFRDTWARVLPVAADVLAGVERLQDFVMNEVIRVDCERWHDGRVVLLGDAAHAMAPNLGQGAGSALVDAAVLAWELARPGAVPDALGRYEARRRPAVRVVQDLADRLAMLSDLAHPALRWVRDGTLRLLGPWLAGDVPLRLLEQTDPLWLRLAAADPRAA